MKAKSPVGSYYDGAERFFAWLSYAALFLLAVLTAIDAFLRYLFSAPLPGRMEACDEFFMPAIIIFSMAYVFHQGGHVRVTLLSDLLPIHIERALRRIFDAMTAGLFAIIAWGLVGRAIEAWRAPEYSPSPLGYLIYPSYVIVAIGAAMMVVRALQASVTGVHASEIHADIID